MNCIRGFGATASGALTEDTKELDMCATHDGFMADEHRPKRPGTTSDNLIPFGLRDGQLLHVDEVERGLECGCVCAGCKGPLVARQGAQNIHHFAHASGAGCEGAYETALHLAAKAILEEEMHIVLPPVTTKLENNRAPVEFAPEKDHLIDSVVLEKKLGTTIPDVIAVISGHKLAIEIKVTHGVDDEKLTRIEREGVSTIEIDLSDLPRNLDKDLICFHVVESVERKVWLYNVYAVDRLARLLNSGSQMPVVSRGMALHVDNCPIPARVWRGKPYANVMDDCLYCEFNLQVGGEFIICNGAKKVDRDSSRVVVLKDSYGIDRRPKRRRSPVDNFRL